MISSLITFRLKRLSALSIDSLEFIEIYAIYSLTSFRPRISPKGQTSIKPFFEGIRKRSDLLAPSMPTILHGCLFEYATAPLESIQASF
jgi:hypothetical protein